MDWIIHLFLLKYNKSNGNTYHGINHLLSVTYNSWEIIRSMHELYHFDIILNEEELLIASMFHDFNHTGKIGPDSVNIKLAIDGVNEFIIANNLSNDLNCDVIINIIKSTEFPYKNIPNSILECIIRDADMAYVYNDINFMSFSNFGLGSEYNKFNNVNDIKSWIEGQMQFINNMECYTEYAKKLWSIRKPELIDFLTNIISDFNIV